MIGLLRLLSGSDYVGRGYHHRGAHLVSSRELSCCGGRWQNILAIGRPNMMQRSSGRPRRDGGWRCRQQLGSNTRGDCPCGSLWCFLWSFLCGDSIDDRSWRATQRGLERPRYKHTTLLYSLAVKVFEFPPSRRLVRVCRGKFVRSSEPSGDFALTGRSPRVSLLLDKLLSPKSLLSDSHPSVSKPSSSLSLACCPSAPHPHARIRILTQSLALSSLIAEDDRAPLT